MTIRNSTNDPEDIAEQKRIQEIDSIASVINDAELVNEAKYGDAKKGIPPCTAAELAFKAAQRKVESLIYADVDAGVSSAKRQSKSSCNPTE